MPAEQAPLPLETGCRHRHAARFADLRGRYLWCPECGAEIPDGPQRKPTR